MPFSLSPRAWRRLYLFASILLLLDLYAVYNRHHHNGLAYSVNGRIPSDCPSLPGLHDVMLVLKTGVTEAHEKLPVHRNTTLRCIPNYIVWSDYAEEIADIPVHDVLSSEPAALHALPDFSLYTKVQTHGRNALTSLDLADDPSTPFGKTNPGWRLDKWKFIPMIEHTFRRTRRSKWYVFMEADTYIVWANMLAWLDRLDASRPHYLGNQMQIRDVLFAHGGSGFVLSRPAMERATKLIEARREHYAAVTAEEWAGDCVLGILFRDAGVALDWAWPMLQIAPVKELDHFSGNYGRMPWCYPVVSFHHLKPREISELDGLDRAWREQGRRGRPLLFRDVFFELARPKMTEEPAMDWDNESPEDMAVVKSVEECWAICQGERYCLQYVLRDNGVCAISRDVRLGEARQGFESGWMLDRIDHTAELLGGCREATWIRPP
ncbi:uncharacterized protein BJX67DRAFT_389174 [Aspergillus lucknowensis]|uniref:N-acetylgalactosaminide beta-1,3-galactosyltransferase n=1 Tax=Aspergillus lucknowensis TaxID=176173 RepID=A0ABR4M516_9EURO